MNLRTTIGQYYDTVSVIHRLDPRVKIGAVFFYVISLFFIKKTAVYALAGIILVLLFFAARIPFRYAVRGLKGFGFLLAFTFLCDIFFTPGDPLIKIGILKITRQGAVLGTKICLRLIFMISSSSLMTYTTTSDDIARGLESIMKPLGYIKVPVHDISTMITIALRFIPILVDEFDRIEIAQRARGADFEKGGIADRIRRFMPLLVPLFSSALKKAGDLSLAMDARCYNSGPQRTQYRVLHLKTADILFLGAAVCYTALIIFVLQ